jgi:hypothetical protein
VQERLEPGELLAVGEDTLGDVAAASVRCFVPEPFMG